MTLQDIIALDKQYYLNTFGDRTPVAFERGEGATLYDCEGNAYLDCFTGIAVTSLGHAHPAVTQAICEQAGRLLHTSNYYYNETQARLAQLIVDNMPCDRVFIANTGAEANEGMFKLVRKYFKQRGEDKYVIISAHNSFHGRTLANVAATGQKKYQDPYTPLPQGFVNVNYNDIEAIRSAIDEHTAAVLIETTQGEGGVIEGRPQYLQDVQALCRERGLLLLIDEVQTGMGRTGSLVSFTQFGLEPDAFSLAKALANGVPIGALCAREPLASAFEPGDHGTTFGGNPLACAAAIATLKTMLAENLPARAAELGAYIKDRLNVMTEQHPCIMEVRGRGLLIGLRLTPDTPLKQVVAYAQAKGVILGAANYNTLRMAPPLTFTKEQADAMLAVLNTILP